MGSPAVRQECCSGGLRDIAACMIVFYEISYLKCGHAVPSALVV